MLGWIILLFLAMPFIELWLLIEIGQRIGVWETLAIVIGTGLLGGVLVRWQGASALRSLTSAWREGRSVPVELVAGAAFLVGAALLLTPGVITDIIGFSLMFPPVRRFAARRFISRFKDRITVVSYRPGGPRPAGPDAGAPPASHGPGGEGTEAYDTTGYVQDEGDGG